MENRSLSLVAGLTFGLLTGSFIPSASAWAESVDASKPAPEQRADWEQRLVEAKALQKQGATRNSEAKEAFEAKKKECFKKFRVTACQEEARQKYVQAANEARRIENEGKAREREVKKERLADKDARQLAQEPGREADLRAREAETKAVREHSESTREAKLTKKEEKARAGTQRRAADEERLKNKQEQHERKLAERMEKARQREAEENR